MKRFCEYVGMVGDRIDWDFDVSPEQWAALAENAGHCIQFLAHNDRDWALVSHLSKNSISPFFVDRKPASKWCSICLTTDTTPHLRWYWRIVELQTCPYHDVDLSLRCPWCLSCVNLSRASMVPWGRHRGTQSLAGCASCGMPFIPHSAGEAASAEVTKGPFATATATASAVMAAVRNVLNRRALSISQQVAAAEAARARQATLIFEFSTPRAYSLLNLNPRSMNTTKREMAADMLARERRRALQVDLKWLAVFRSQLSSKLTGRKSFWAPSEITKWSAFLSPPQRIRLAKALLIIRREKALQKNRALNGVTVEDEQWMINENASLHGWR